MSKATNPKERLIETALRLFYTQGYHSTGINQIIAEADVAKASFYDHFSNKEELCVAFLKRRHELWLDALKQKLSKERNSSSKILAIFSFIEEWMKKDKFRGCAFLNMASEFSDSQSKVRKVISWHKNELKDYCEELIELHYSKNKLSAAQIKALSKQFYILIDGAIVCSQVQHDVWPIRTAKNTAKQLLDI